MQSHDQSSRSSSFLLCPLLFQVLHIVPNYGIKLSNFMQGLMLLRMRIDGCGGILSLLSLSLQGWGLLSRSEIRRKLMLPSQRLQLGSAERLAKDHDATLFLQSSLTECDLDDASIWIITWLSSHKE